MDNSEKIDIPHTRYEQHYSGPRTPYNFSVYKRSSPTDNQAVDRVEVSTSDQDVIHKPNFPQYMRRNKHYPPPD